MDEAVRELEARLVRYPADRYPVQHATAQFHLGSLRGDAEALAVAVRLFEGAQLDEERAKAVNALGAALRDGGDAGAAAGAFADAAAAFERLGLGLELGAALYNLGLVTRDPDALERARELLAESQQRAAAARELGVVRLERGELAGAEEPLEAAREAGDPAAPNALGLLRLAEGRADEAAVLFREAAAAHPRSVRPAEHAMAKANLALAHERRGDLPRARLAARQALGVAQPPPAVVEQAGGVLARAGDARGDLHAVLDEDPRPELVREEVVRWAEAPAPERREWASEWLEGQRERDDGRAELLVAALLELPPDALRALAGALVEAEPDAALRAQLRRACARFHLPQQERLEALLAQVSAELGREWP